MSHRVPHLVLMGLRGSGKSTLGALVASRLGVVFVDLDDRTRALLGAASVAQAWRERGEPAFREAETRALERALGEPACVIALGGGTPTAPGAAALLRGAAAVVVYLRADAPTLRARLAPTVASDPDRPTLTGTDALTEIDAVLRDRDGAYRGLADHVLEVGGLPPDRAVERLAELARSA